MPERQYGISKCFRQLHPRKILLVQQILIWHLKETMLSREIIMALWFGIYPILQIQPSWLISFVRLPKVTYPSMVISSLCPEKVWADASTAVPKESIREQAKNDCVVYEFLISATSRTLNTFPMYKPAVVHTRIPS